MWNILDGHKYNGYRKIICYIYYFNAVVKNFVCLYIRKRRPKYVRVISWIYSIIIYYILQESRIFTIF